VHRKLISEIAPAKRQALREVAESCFSAILQGNYTVEHFRANPMPHPEGKMDSQKAKAEVDNYLLYLAAEQLKDKRFKQVYEYVLIPNVSAKIRQLANEASYLDIMNFISPGSEGFPQVTAPKE